jgi:methylated-DNA-[protein]-cysteine S-methyltransferase
MFYTIMESPVGPLTIAGDDDGLRFILFGAGRRAAGPGADWKQSEQGVVGDTVRQLTAYFARKLTRFDLPLMPDGTQFQLGVWRELLRIPYGEVISYGELARRIGKPKASRAVGAANGSNPIPIVVPCHRVIGCNGKLTGYGGGLPAKEALLRLEGSQEELFP